jgi:hypothetical protein
MHHRAGPGVMVRTSLSSWSARAGGGDGFCQADGEVQRVDMPRATVDLATDIKRRADQSADAVAVQRFGLV